ncbi:MAG: hypothetical protein DRJ01_11195 [Bacteroidetes bacterium]|nr:MAG: hypothetical protein DRJ01_11195 [Bacteroidota bacterium]
MITIKQFFARISPLKDEYWHLFSSKLEKREFSKKQIILQLKKPLYQRLSLYRGNKACPSFDGT